MSNNKNFFNWLKKLINEWTNRNISDSVIEEKIPGTVNELKCACGNTLHLDSEITKLKCVNCQTSKPITINTTNLGFFSNIRALKNLYPKAGKGDMATVGNVTYVYDEKWRKL